MNKANDDQINIYLTLDQSSLILEALIEQPFKLVFEVIGVINQQAQKFYQPNADFHPQLIALTKSDLSICVQALGELPYSRVCELVNYLSAQMNSQLSGSSQFSSHDMATR